MLPGGCPPAPPPPRLRVAAQKVGCWRPGFWVPSLLLVAPFMRWARRHWSVPPPVLRERLARRAAVRPPARRGGGAPVFSSRGGGFPSPRGGPWAPPLLFFSSFFPLFFVGGKNRSRTPRTPTPRH